MLVSKKQKGRAILLGGDGEEEGSLCGSHRSYWHYHSFGSNKFVSVRAITKHLKGSLC